MPPPVPPGPASAPWLRVMSLDRAMTSESERYAGAVCVLMFSRNSLNERVRPSSSRWLEPWISQYSSCTLRFHQDAGHGVGSSHGPVVAITGASRRAAEATL